MLKKVKLNTSETLLNRFKKKGINACEFLN